MEGTPTSEKRLAHKVSVSEERTAQKRPATLRSCFRAWAALGLVWTYSQAAIYYVDPYGHDQQDGSELRPWRTLGRAAQATVAGDVVIVRPGDYDEHVYETSSGTADQPIVWRAEVPHQASLRAFRVGEAHVHLDGLRLSGYSGVNNSWGAAIRVEPNAHSCVITNCWISDAPYVIAHDFRFDHTQNAVISDSSDFIAAGFRPGSKVYLGSSGLDGLWYTNHDTSWIIASNTATILWLTNQAGNRFLPDSGSNYWAVIRPGGAGLYGILFVRSAGQGASNAVISGNVFSNWMGHAMSVTSRGTRIENNRATQLKSFFFLSFDGSDLVIRSNVVKNSPNLLYYSLDELGRLIHPAGTGWYDYQVSMIRGESADGLQPRTNIVVEWNWFENVDNQIGRVDDGQPDTYGIVYRNNVFIGMPMHFSGGRDGMQWISNTFYRCAFDTGHPLALGGRPPAQTNYVLRHNLFIDCGSPWLYRNSGWYGISTNVLSADVDWNMVASGEITGYAAKVGFSEPNGINGGDPGFVNPNDPDGPDDAPFTDDDGLKVLPGSPGAAIGGGALGVYWPTDQLPVAHFRIVQPVGWLVPPRREYDEAWLTNSPTRRDRVQRPYQTPPYLGQPPIVARFDASLCWSGDNGGQIVRYEWNFGDGMQTVTTQPTVEHIFTRPGDWTVTLRVVNHVNRTHIYQNTYRVGYYLGTAGTGKPQPPRFLRVLVE